MKKIILALAAALISIAAFAIPAKKGVFIYTQPDGSTIKLERHGDEFFSWTTIAGTKQVVELDERGYWIMSSIDPVEQEQANKRRSLINSSRSSFSLRSTHNDDPMTHGQRHIPVFLVNFSDKKFSISSPAEKFNNLLNQSGYSANGGTGSVRDFYLDNSHGAFEPIFDVYGPVDLTNNMAYYGGNSGGGDKQPQLAVLHAAQSLNSTVDFSQYDYDNDGYVDMILMYYAGYNEAEGGPANSIWPHQWSLYGQTNESFDGKRLGAYFCTSELKGYNGTNMCGIGTTCHEFGHSLGLPDFYDTNYETNGDAGALYDFSTMCGGSYNNNGCTPPYFNAEERIILGWMADSDIQDLPAGTTSIASAKDDIAYRTYTDVDGEYFLYECRDGSGWDAPLPTGLLIYHVDKSTVRYVGGITPYEQWVNWGSYNSINAYGSHPCFYLIPSSSLTSLYYTGYMSGIIFPGSKNVTSYTPVDWNKSETGVSVSGISYNSGIVSITATFSTERTVVGKVSSQSGQPVAGVTVSLSEISSPVSAPMLRIAKRGYSKTAVTDSNGSFSIELDGFEGTDVHLAFTKAGWQTVGKDVTLSARVTQVNVTMLQEGETAKVEYSYYDTSVSSDGWYIYGDGESTSLMAAIRIPADDLPAGGGTLTSVSFPHLWAATYYVIVDSGDQRILTHKLNGFGSSMNSNSEISSFDLSSLNVQFSSDRDLYVGIGVQNAQIIYSNYMGYLFFITEGGNNIYIDEFDLNSSNWESEEDGYALILSASIIGGGAGPVDPPVEAIQSLADMGFVSIADPGNGKYTEGHSFPLELSLPEGVTAVSESWYFDGTDLTGCSSITLLRGKHIVTAEVSLSDGTKETLQLTIQVQ